MIPASIRSFKSQAWVPVRLWDYSPSGFGILYSSNSGHADFSTVGENIDLRLGGLQGFAAAGEKGIVIPCRIENSSRLEKGMRIGLSRQDLSESWENDREGFLKDYLYDGIRPLTAKILNPFLYNELAPAKLIGIGPKTTFVFSSADASLLLFAGARMTVNLEVPLDSTGTFTGTLSWIRSSGDGSVVFAILDTDISFELSNAVGEHFIRAEICKPSQLAELGIRMKRFKDQFRFRFISTQEEYQNILNLRRTAYVNAGKVAREATVDPIATEFDSRSRLLTAFHNEILVASVALSFGGAEGAPLRSQGCFPDSKYPVPVPNKELVVEVHSLCTDFDYRGGDLIQGMFEHIARSILFTDRQWLLTFTTSKLWPLYRRIGFRKTGASVVMQDMGGLEHHMILMHRNSLVSGLRMMPFAWNYFFGQMVRDLQSKGVIRLGLLQNSRVAFYSLFAGLTRRWMRTQLEREFRVLLQKKSGKEAEYDR